MSGVLKPIALVGGMSLMGKIFHPGTKREKQEGPPLTSTSYDPLRESASHACISGLRNLEILVLRRSLFIPGNKIRISFTDIENRLVVIKGEGGMEWEFGISRCKLVYIEWINSKVLLCCTGNYIQYPMINHNGNGAVYVYIYTYIHIYS